MKRMKELEDQNPLLKKMYSEGKLKSEIAKDIIEKSYKVSPPMGVGKIHPK